MNFYHRRWLHTHTTVAVKHLMFPTSPVFWENFPPLPSFNTLPCSLPSFPTMSPPSLVLKHSQPILKCPTTDSYSYPLPFTMAKTELFRVFPLLQYLPVNPFSPASFFQLPFAAQCPKMQQKTYHILDDSMYFGTHSAPQKIVQSVWLIQSSSFPLGSCSFRVDVHLDCLATQPTSMSLCPGQSDI